MGTYVNLSILFALLFFTACESFPKDPNNSLNDSTKGTIVVGYTVHPPFVFVSHDSVDGIEAELIKAFALEIGATIVWEEQPEAVLAQKLKKQQLDIAIGGFTTKSHYKKELAFTRPYLKAGAQYVIAIAPGENALLLRFEKFLQTKAIL